MNPYKHYKDSGIEWIGDIPEHWEVRRLKQVADTNKKALLETTDEDYSFRYVDISSVNADGNVDLNEQVRFAEAPSRARRIIQQNDTIISTVRTYLKAVAHFEEAVKDTIVSTGFAVCTPKLDVINGRFLYYSLRSESCVEQVVAVSKGVSYPATTASELAAIYLAFPPPAEQAAIAEYLDRQTAEIDATLARKEAMLKKLGDLRAARIHEVVTRGLHPNTPLKPSGVEWIGDIPEHWEVRRLKNCVRINPTKTQEDSKGDEDEVVFLPMERVKENGTYMDDQFRKYKEVSSGFTFMREGDVIVAKITPCFENGKSAYLKAISTGIAFGSTEFHVLRPKENMHGPFIHYLIRSSLFRDLGEASMTGAAGQQRVPTEFVANYAHALPPLAEQTAIAEYLDAFTQKTDALRGQLKAQMEALRQYRQSLITEVVTGKLRVG